MEPIISEAGALAFADGISFCLRECMVIAKYPGAGRGSSRRSAR
jgi:hypothetical protein